MIKSWYEYDWAGAEKEFQAALALEPGLITALLWQSLYFSAIGKALGCCRFSPKSSRDRASLRQRQSLSRRGAASRRTIRSRSPPDATEHRDRSQLLSFPHVHGQELVLARALSTKPSPNINERSSLPPKASRFLLCWLPHMASKGERQRALTLLKRVRAAEDRTDPSVIIAMVYAALGEVDEMFKCDQAGSRSKIRADLYRSNQPRISTVSQRSALQGVSRLCRPSIHRSRLTLPAQYSG